MATRHRGYSVPARLASTLSQAKVTFLDEISYTKLQDFEKEEISQEQGDEYSSKPSDSKNCDKIQELLNDAHELPTEKARLSRTSRHWSPRRPKFQNTKNKNQSEIKGEPKNDNPDKEPRERKTSGLWGSKRPVRRNALRKPIHSPKYPSIMIILVFSLMKSGPERGKQADIGVTEEQGFETLQVIPFFLMSSLPPPSRWPSSRSSLSTFFSLSSTRPLTSRRYRN